MGKVTRVDGDNAYITYYMESKQKREIYRSFQSTALAVRPSQQAHIDMQLYHILGEKPVAGSAGGANIENTTQDDVTPDE